MAFTITQECINCGACVGVCPTDSIETSHHGPRINPNTCNECRDSLSGPVCLGTCPIEGAITESCRMSPEACAQCPETIVCTCLRVSVTELVEALATRQIRSLKDIKHQTGAGDGCMMCHRVLKRYLQQRIG